MKKIKFACNLSLLTLFALGQWACAWDPYEHDSDPVRETLELTASASQIALDENDLSATVLTFDWTPARPMPDEYLVSYTTKLDLLNNNFGSSTSIVTSEDDGIFIRSYTSEQINNWANERWKVPVNKTFTLAFRVIAEYAGGPTYEMPEVRTVEVTVTPIKVDVFDADKVSLSGTAISSVTEIEKTVENANLYAWYGALSIGELQIPVELEGQTYYIVPSDGSGTLTFSNGTTLRFSSAKSMTATAYTAGHDGVGYTTASGTLVDVGTVAVDRKVIPLGTKLYIVTNDGIVYGTAVARDTGVRGNVIDLYYNTYRECIEFGRRSWSGCNRDGDGKSPPDTLCQAGSLAGSHSRI